MKFNRDSHNINRTRVWYLSIGLGIILAQLLVYIHSCGISLQPSLKGSLVGCAVVCAGVVINYFDWFWN